jgi:hypothetical protein
VPSTTQVLQALVGLRLSLVRNAAGMRVFHFGEVRPHQRGKGTVGEYALHIQCPWRLVSPDGVITGSSDSQMPPRNGGEVDPSDPRAGSLQNIRLASLLTSYDDVTKSHLNATGELVVKSASADQYGSADIAFSGGVHLQLFPDGSAEEDWRFFKTGGSGTHFVIEGGRVTSK